MPLTDKQIDDVVKLWNAYAEGRPNLIKPRDLVDKRDIAMYRGLGLKDSLELAELLVEHRSIATLEMSMGYLYERLLGALGPTKVTTAQKRQPGYRGIDFVQPLTAEIRLINLKAGLSTFNGDITQATKRNLANAKRWWSKQGNVDDNPIGGPELAISTIRAVARGHFRQELTEDGILWLVGDGLWEYFGAGSGFLRRISDSLGRSPLNHDRYKAEQKRAARRVVRFLELEGFADEAHNLNWSALTAKFP